MGCSRWLDRHPQPVILAEQPWPHLHHPRRGSERGPGERGWEPADVPHPPGWGLAGGLGGQAASGPRCVRGHRVGPEALRVLPGGTPRLGHPLSQHPWQPPPPVALPASCPGSRPALHPHLCVLCPHAPRSCLCLVVGVGRLVPPPPPRSVPPRVGVSNCVSLPVSGCRRRPVCAPGLCPRVWACLTVSLCLSCAAGLW